MKKVFVTFLAASAVFASCTKDDAGMTGGSGDNTPILLRSTVLSEDGAKAFAEGDQIGLFMTDNTAATEAFSNQLLTVGADGLTSTPEPIYYPLKSKSVDVIAYAPYQEGLTEAVATVALPQDQSAMEWADYDLLSASISGLYPAASPVDLEFAHRLAKVQVEFKAAEGTSDEVMAEISAKVMGALSGSVDLVTGEVSGLGSAQEVIPSSEGALVLPTTFAAGEPVVKVVTPAGDREVLAPAEGAAFEAGQNNVVSITVDQDNGYTLYFHAQILPWEENVADSIGLVETIMPITDLSAEESANTYIVNTMGDYKFKATVKGNGADGSTLAPASAGVLWRTSATPNLENVKLKDGYVTFSTMAAENDNEVIAVYDAEGKVLWSWHIWIAPGYEPGASDIVTTLANGQTRTFMARNLGAALTEPTEANKNVDVRQTFGMLYQWGRKDPFTNAAGTEVPAENGFGQQIYVKDAASPVNMPIVMAAEKTFTTVDEAIAYSIENPYTFLGGNWGAAVLKSTDWEPLWGYTAAKTIYDPCPAGYRVPDPGDHFWTKIENFHLAGCVDSTKLNYFGAYLYTTPGVSSESAWWPCPGKRQQDHGQTQDVTEDYNSTFYLTNRANGTTTYMYRFEWSNSGSPVHGDGNLYPRQPVAAWQGSPVRCVQE